LSAHLEDTDGSTKVLGLLSVGHRVHLVGCGGFGERSARLSRGDKLSVELTDVLEESLDGLDLGEHVGKLLTNDSLLDEGLAED
jgi:predicted dinucleotide-utilizing enzyme